MIMKSMKEYLQILSSYIYDDDKVVTYKWLSKKLEVHVNVAKQILWEFWQKHKTENNIECTVILIGDLKTGGMRVEVVRESNLLKAKEKFSVIKSEHLYSIQKCLADLELLASCGQGDVKFSGIKCKDSVERTSEELSLLRWGSLHKDQSITNSKERSKNTDDSKQLKAPLADDIDNQIVDKHITKKKTGGSPKSSLSSFFVEVTNKEKCSDANVEETVSTENSNVNKKASQPIIKSTKGINRKGEKNDLASYFGKNANLKKDITSSVLNDNKKDNTSSIKNKSSNQIISSQSTCEVEKSTRGTKRNRSKESNDFKPKRKRIITRDNDTSESESETEAMDIPSSPEPDFEPEVVLNERNKSPSPPSKIIGKNGRARVLKVIDKTYEEDGFLVTKKVHEYESCSEDESTVEEAVPPVKEPKTAAKKKQTTLTNFFSKS